MRFGFSSFLIELWLTCWLPQKPTLAETQNSDAPGISKAAAIGLGVAVGVPSIAATVIVGWCLRKRQRRAAMERRRLKRSEFVIS